METITNFSGNWLEIAAAIYLLGMILYGHHKGFIRLAVSAAAVAVTLITVQVSLPYVTEWMRNNTSVYDRIQANINEVIGLDELLMQFADNEKIQKEDQWEIIEELSVPDQLKSLLVKNNNSEVYSQMKVELFQDYISGFLTEALMRMVSFLILFLLIYLAIRFLVVWLDLVAKLPILSGMNQIAGALLGAVVALFFVWLVCFVFTAFSGTKLGTSALMMIEESSWLSWIYDHNLLSALVLGMIRIL